MAQISGSKNLFHTYEMSLRDDITNVDNAFEKLIEILTENKAENLFGVSEGFVPYQFEPRSPINISSDVQNSKVDKKLVVKYYDQNIKRNKDYPTGLQNFFDSPEIPDETKELVQKYLIKDTYKTLFQDYIFVPGESIKLIFPAENKDKVLENQLMPHFEDIFEFNIDSIARKITQDVLKWIVWKIKKHDDGVLGEEVLIEEIKMYNSCAHLNEGEMKVSTEKTESNIYANISMVLGQPCKGIEMKLLYQEEEFHFILLPEGIYSPFWGTTKFRGHENNLINRILILEKISLEIIPYIYTNYIKDKPNWDSLKEKVADDAHNELSILFSKK